GNPLKVRTGPQKGLGRVAIGVIGAIAPGSRHGIIALPAPGVATADPAGGQPAATQATVTFQRLKRIGRASRLKAAAMADPRAGDQPIAAHGQSQDPRKRRHVLGLRGAWTRATASVRSFFRSAKS